MFNAIKRLTQKTEKIFKSKGARENDKDWIQQKLPDWQKIRDISQTRSTPSTPSTPLSINSSSSPLSPSKRTTESPFNFEEFGRGKRTKFHKSSCNLDCCSVRRALFVDDVLEIYDNYNNYHNQETEEEVVPDDGDPDYIDESEPKQKPEPKTPRPNFEHVIALQERFNTPDTQVALWWNIVSL